MGERGDISEDDQIFLALDLSARQRLLDSATPVTFKSGDVILREGEEGKNFYLIDNGHVEVSTKASGEMLVLATLNTGAVFGEVPVFSKKPRTATVTASSAVEVLRFENSELESLLEENPLAREELESLVLGRAKDTIEKIIDQGKNH